MNHVSAQARKSNLRLNIDRTVIVVLFLALWQIAANRQWTDPVFTGSPLGIAQFLYDETVKGLLVSELAWTMGGALISFAVGSVAAVTTGLLFLAKPRLEGLLNPIFTALNSMPRIALAPLFLIWFGLGLGSKIAMGASLTYFIVLSSTLAGGRAVTADHLQLATVLDASAVQRFFRFVLPSAIPTLFVGLRLGLIYALLGVVGSEIIASEHGLGQMISILAAGFKTNGVLGIIIVLAILGSLLSAIMNRIEARLLFWR